MNISNENRNVLSSVLPGKKPSNSQIVSSKIKSKILNTSSFFKVSLKTNNKALALALVAQKERSRQLEVETVQLRKQVESLCFDLAIRRHKDNQLILILKELQRNTLGHLERAVDLFSDENDDSEIYEEGNKQPPNKDERNHVERVQVQIPLVTEKQSKNLSPAKRTSSSTSQEAVVNDRNNTSTNPSQVPPVSYASKDPMNELEQRVDNKLKSTQKRTSRRSSSLKDDVENWSRFDVTGVDPIAGVLTSVSTTSNQLSSGTSEVADHPNSLKVKTALEPPKKNTTEEAEETTNGTAMEITIGDSTAEIVTVETKPKNTGRTKKPKESKTKIPCLLTNVGKVSCGSARVSDKPKVKSMSVNVDSLLEVQKVSSAALWYTDNPTAEGVDVQHREEDFVENSTKETDFFNARRKTHVTARVTKHIKPSRDAHKTTQDDPKQFDPRKTYTFSLQTESHSSVSHDHNKDDYFDDPETLNSAFKLDRTNLLVVDTIEDKSSNTKSLKRKTFVISNETSSKGSRNTSKGSRKTKAQPMDHELDIEAEDDAFIREESYSHKGGTDYVDMDTTLSVSGHTHRSSRTTRRKSTTQSIKQPTNSSSAVKCRGTFVVSVNRDSSSLNKTISDDGFSEKQACPTDDYTVAENETTVVRRMTGQYKDHCRASQAKHSVVEETPAASKRPWLATQEPDENVAVLESLLVEEMPPWALDDHFSIAAGQKPKKARREVSVKLKKKKDAKKDDSSGAVKGRKMRRCSTKVSPFPDGGSLSVVSLDNQDRTYTAVAAQNTKAQPLSQIQVLHYNTHSATEDVTEACEHLSSPETRSSDLKVSIFKPRSNQVLNTLRRDTFILPISLNESSINRKTFVNSDCISRDEDDTNSRASKVSVAEIHTEIPDHRNVETVHESLRELLMDEMPPWESSIEVCCFKPTGFDTSDSNPRRVTSARKVAVFEEQSEVTTEISPADTALKPLTNTNWTDNEDTGRTRRRGATVSYKEPPINCKMRRGDKFSDTRFLSSPIYKDKIKKKRQNTRQKHDHLKSQNVL
ncbi:shugoshin 2 isoform X1 [Esox lucius]|uniref:shugoshin 2 isoform X1 n=1 Tax=Esox lucius TaxID=8010 RepID=UPI00147785C2|nr:shugoshin 2 isoform X1 [Esox lucius]